MATNTIESIDTDGKNTKHAELLSPVLRGQEMSTNEFKDWIEQAESKPTISLQEAKDKWITKRKHLQQSIK